jgi:hypothetical protein
MHEIEQWKTFQYYDLGDSKIFTKLYMLIVGKQCHKTFFFIDVEAPIEYAWTL